MCEIEGVSKDVLYVLLFVCKPWWGKLLAGVPRYNMILILLNDFSGNSAPLTPPPTPKTIRKQDSKTGIVYTMLQVIVKLAVM